MINQKYASEYRRVKLKQMAKQKLLHDLRERKIFSSTWSNFMFTLLTSPFQLNAIENNKNKCVWCVRGRSATFVER